MSYVILSPTASYRIDSTLTRLVLFTKSGAALLVEGAGSVESKNLCIRLLFCESAQIMKF